MTPQRPTDRFAIIHDQPEDGVHRLTLAGGLDDTAVTSLHALASEHLAALPRLLALDLTDLAGLPPSGVRILDDIARSAGRADIALCLIAPPHHPVHDALVAAELRELFELHPDLPAALAAMH
ncbi:STAS domain-containing protein [Pseudonocardia acidicola]|uniref:STAS domain-containing protein n=1 Tax=Pseudonocardia acidicola TaxID=2724939 RepID=A0ABX1S8Z4_9PSEU|nr:STAS domain-containing protein [Pseudonocardia acidicola]NMH98034.1 hypothetical protein [Pseudonocardia acidicola]